MSPATINNSQDFAESALEREFYRYYRPEPLAAAATAHRPGFGDLHIVSCDPGIRRRRGPRSSYDTALTAFAQLGALRLNARRCMISFFDRKNQYILAEATRTLSLQTDIAQQQCDELWLGATVLPKGHGICEHTVKLSPMYEMSSTGIYMEVTSQVIPDLRKDERFKDKAYVTGSPGARFYAGVPIRSPGGASIGSYCVLDDQPRDGLDASSLEFMKEMAVTVMKHLEMAKAQDDHRRGGVMVRGLGSFIEGKSTTKGWSFDSPKAMAKTSASVKGYHVKESEFEHNQKSQDTVPKAPQNSHSSPGPGSGPLKLPSEESVLSALRAGSQLKEAFSSTESSTVTSATSSNIATPTSEKPATVANSGDTRPSVEANAEPDLQDVVLAPNVKNTFQRAADSIREATEVEGAMFFDASVGSFAGLVEASEGKDQALHDDSDSSLPHVRNAKDTSESTDKIRRIRSGLDEKQCRVLGLSLSSGIDPETGRGSGKELVMTERFLKGLLRRYPRGKVFNFDDSIAPTSPASIDNDLHMSTSYEAVFDTDADLESTIPTRRSRKLSWQSESLILHEIFPRARCLALCPLWDSHRERWFAANIIWTTQAMRIFTNEEELSYLTAFGNCVMAEVARLDAKQADRAKADLLSSISHELRSPLHGVLGSVELLQDTTLDAFQRGTIHTISTCGRTLLDTINHLLDFAKINNLVRESKGTTEPNVKGHRRTKTIENAESASTLPIASEDIADLSEIMEEVLESVYAGYDFQQHAAQDIGEAKLNVWDKQTPRLPSSGVNGSRIQPKDESNRIRVIVEIDKASNWVFKTNAGAWRRILMNLFGNSLKYTERGSVKVSLHMKTVPSKPGIDASQITLTVSDSGKGISNEYLRNRLFTPFAQEDSRSPGTGLGLSITRQIVASLGGSIKVQSEQGIGTEVTVACSLAHAGHLGDPQNHIRDDSSRDFVEETRKRRLKVCLLGFETERVGVTTNLSEIESLAMSSFKASIEKLCIDWLGLEVGSASHLEDKPVDLFIATHEVASIATSLISNGHAKDHAGDPLSARPVVILCRAAATTQSTSMPRSFGGTTQVVEYISQPCGPLKLAKAIDACLQRQNQKVQPLVTSLTKARDEAAADEAAPDARRQSLLTSRFEMQRPRATTEPALPQAEGLVTPLRSDSAGPDSRSDLPVAATTIAQVQLPSSPSFSFLLVDDNAINLRLLATYMKKKGHRFETAIDGLEALEKYKAASDPFDWVIMDITMPVMDGLTATREIRAFERDAGKIPAQVIALTGLASASVQQEAFTSGVNVFLPKPVRLTELSRIILATSSRSQST